MRYKDALRTLEKLTVFGMKPGLDRIRALLAQINNPSVKLKVILVGGTNGKGSVCAYLSSILARADYKVGLYTSPHLIDYTERIKINNTDITRREFLRLFKVVYAAAQAVNDRPTVFEILTAMAILHFAQKKVDLAVVEVGLGGTYDATNILEPFLSVITNVELDHTDVLGKTLAKIAKDKAGIIRPGAYLVTGDDKSTVLKVLKQVCKKKRTKLIQAKLANKLSSGHGSLVTGHWSYSSPIPHFQQKNLAVVETCVAVLRQLGYHIPKRVVQTGIKSTKWPARFQILSREPLIILDGAHNPSGVRSLVNSLGQVPRPAALVFGAISGKNVNQMLKLLKPGFEVMFIAGFDHPKALAPKTLLRLAKIRKRAKTFSSPLLALEKARRDGYKTTVICGSLYLAGEVLKRLTR